MRWPTGRWALAAVALLVAALGTTAVIGASGNEADPPGRQAGAARETPQATPPSTGPGGEPELLDVQQAGEVDAPVQVEVPSLGIESRLDDLGLDAAGRLDTPPRWQVAGWYAGGPRPGDAGPAVIAGHVDSPTGPAVFTRLSEIGEGDVIRVTDSSGQERSFAVDRTTTTPRNGFPTEAVYGPTPDPQLRLITCDGEYDEGRGGYQDNLLVFATEVDP